MHPRPADPPVRCPSVLVCATQLAAQCARALCLAPQVLESRRRLERLQTAQRDAATQQSPRQSTHTRTRSAQASPPPIRCYPVELPSAPCAAHIVVVAGSHAVAHCSLGAGLSTKYARPSLDASPVCARRCRACRRAALSARRNPLPGGRKRRRGRRAKPTVKLPREPGSSARAQRCAHTHAHAHAPIPMPTPMPTPTPPCPCPHARACASAPQGRASSPHAWRLRARAPHTRSGARAS